MLVLKEALVHVTSNSLSDHILMDVANLNPHILPFRNQDVLATFLIAV